MIACEFGQVEVATASAGTASHPHPGSMRLDMTVQSFTAALIDDRSCGGQLEVLTLRLQVASSPASLHYFYNRQ